MFIVGTYPHCLLYRQKKSSFTGENICCIYFCTISISILLLWYSHDTAVGYILLRWCNISNRAKLSIRFPSGLRCILPRYRFCSKKLHNVTQQLAIQFPKGFFLQILIFIHIRVAFILVWTKPSVHMPLQHAADKEQNTTTMYD